jgi:hypothetical protein
MQVTDATCVWLLTMRLDPLVADPMGLSVHE